MIGCGDIVKNWWDNVGVCETLGKHLSISKTGLNLAGRHQSWNVFNKQVERLGVINWDTKWKRYVLEPDFPTKWDEGCLTEVSVFLRTQNRGHKDD